MHRNLEYRHGNDWRDRMMNALTIPAEFVLPVVSVQWGYGSGPAWSWWNLLNLKVYTGREANGSLYQNGVLFVRVMLPFWVGVQLRYSETSYWQVSLPGWKLIGRPGWHFRHQTDASAQGGLAIGYEDGPK